MNMKRILKKKLGKFGPITGNINNTLKPTSVQKPSTIEVYNALVFPILLYDKESWTPKQKDKKRPTSIEMKVFRRTAVHILLDHKRNEDIFEELKVETVDEKLRRYKSNWLRHATRTNSKRLPKIMLNYRSNIKKKLGRPLKRRLDQAETGLFKHDS